MSISSHGRRDIFSRPYPPRLLVEPIGILRAVDLPPKRFVLNTHFEMGDLVSVASLSIQIKYYTCSFAFDTDKLLHVNAG